MFLLDCSSDCSKKRYICKGFPPNVNHITCNFKLVIRQVRVLGGWSWQCCEYEPSHGCCVHTRRILAVDLLANPAYIGLLESNPYYTIEQLQRLLVINGINFPFQYRYVYVNIFFAIQAYTNPHQLQL